MKTVTPLQLKEILGQNIPLSDDSGGILGSRRDGIFDPVLTPRVGPLEGKTGDETVSDRQPKASGIIGKGYKPPFVLDVRQSEELKVCALPQVFHIPLGSLPDEFQKLPKDQDIFVICHHGYRSAQAVMFLESQGFSRVFNVEGGIHAWAEQVEPTMLRY